MRWHLERGGHPTAGASWFDIGTAMHSVYERGIERQWKTPAPYIKHAVEEVLSLVSEGKGNPNGYLTSKHRPINEPALTVLARDLAISFFENVIINPPDWLPPLYGTGWSLEHNVQVGPEHPGWQWKAGASTTIDALYLGDRFILVDWKTGRSRSSDPRQLQFYRYLLEQLGYTAAHNVWGAFFHAEHGTWQIVDEYDPDAVERLIGSSQALKQARPEARASWLCDYCPARDLCPAWAEDEYDAAVLTAQVELARQGYSYELMP